MKGDIQGLALRRHPQQALHLAPEAISLCFQAPLRLGCSVGRHLQGISAPLCLMQPVSELFGALCGPQGLGLEGLTEVGALLRCHCRLLGELSDL